jgi:hypothetical protein
LQEPAGHWQEEPQLHPWSPIIVVSIKIAKVAAAKMITAVDLPRYDPAIPKSDQDRGKRGSSGPVEKSRTT